jgi:rhomboid protease GluP
MPTCFKCGTELQVNEEGVAPVLCDRCAGRATARAQRGISLGSMSGAPVTITLMAINIGVYLGMWLTGGSLLDPGRQIIRWGGNIGMLTLSGEYWRLVTAAFVHGGLSHIAINMWCLYSLGRLCERLFGKIETLLLYLLTGVGGAILSLAYEPTRNEVGASGAIFGLAAALLIGMKFGDLQISSGEKRSALGSLVFFVMISFGLGMSGNTDNMCHLGGFISGLIIGLPMATSFSASQYGTLIRTIILTAASVLLVIAGHELVTLHGHESRMSVAKIATYNNDFPAAISLLERDTSSGHTSADAYSLLGNIYEATGQRDKAVLAYERAVALDPADQNSAESLNELTGKIPAKPKP